MTRILFAFFVALGMSSGAVVATFTSSPAFLGAIGPSQTFDFNQPNGPIGNLGSLLSVATVGGDANGQVTSNTLCGSFGGGVDCFRPVLLTFALPGRAFGYTNLDLTIDEEAVVTLNFANGDPSQVFTFDLGGQPVFSPIFFGAVSNVNLSSVQIYSRTIGTTTVGDRANVIDNVTVQAAVPEPAPFVSIGCGCLLIIAARRFLVPSTVV